MYKEVYCPICNRLMVIEIRHNENTIYKCPIHSYSKPIGEANGGVHMHIPDNPNQVFKSLAH